MSIVGQMKMNQSLSFHLNQRIRVSFEQRMHPDGVKWNLDKITNYFGIFAQQENNMPELYGGLS